MLVTDFCQVWQNGYLIPEDAIDPLDILDGDHLRIRITILLLKMLLMSLITTFYRLQNKVCDIIAFLSTLLSKIAAQTRNPELVIIHLTLHRTINFVLDRW